MKNLEFSARTREEDLLSLANRWFDVLVVGGGINGSGVANILSQIGLKTILVEMGDFASGTSSASSKLIHGGLRYLQEGRIGEVRNLIRERDYLRNHTPIVKDIEFDILITRNSWNRWKIMLGLVIYNFLGHRHKIPAFRKNQGEYPREVLGYFSYMDAITDDSRLVISNICSAHNRGSVCLNYARLEGVQKVANGFIARITDTLTGKAYSINAGLIVNCTGPWAGKTASVLMASGIPQMKLSKGVHIVIPRDLIHVNKAVAFRSSIDGRQLFIIPRGEVHHIGTTDDFVESPEDRDVKEDEINYLLESTSAIFGKISRDAVITTFCGIRPLVSNSEDPGKATREFSIVERDGIIHVLGGKLTDYRVAARKVARLVMKRLGISINVDGLPVIDYLRENTGDPVQYDLQYECALTLDDVVRRREGWSIYMSDR
ncbi:MAG: glycerol-3-phosphate dehydrogenase/oxidase, partial [Thermoplasmataceae archaeon]